MRTLRTLPVAPLRRGPLLAGIAGLLFAVSACGPSQAPAFDGGNGEPDAASSDGGSEADAGPSNLTCAGILTCEQQCTPGDTTCQRNCYLAGSLPAQALAGALQECLNGACPTTSGGVCATEDVNCLTCQGNASTGACASPFEACEASSTDAGIPSQTDGGADAGNDAGPTDGNDAGSNDAGMGEGNDAGMGEGNDAGLAGGMDAGMAGGMDAGMAGGMDAGMAGGMDAGMAGGMDAGMADAGPADAGTTGDHDAGSATADAGLGTDAGTTGTDAGPGTEEDGGLDAGEEADAGTPTDAGSVSCYEDTMCTGQAVCGVTGICVAPCTSDMQCPDSETCAPDGHCVGTAGTGFPAAAGAPPQVVKGSGSVLSTPTVIPIFFAGDTDAAAILTYLLALPGSVYWAAASEYGVTGLTIGTPVTLAAAASSVTDSQIQTLLAQDLGSKLPEEDGSTIYVLHYPSTTTISLGQGESSCSAFGGYHSNTQGGAPYAVIPRCAGGGTFTTMDVLTVAESHELIEAATDPLPNSSPAYLEVDNAHIYWDPAQGGSEIADMCENDPEAYDNQIPGLTSYYVQRFWSDAAISAGHDPCVPEFANTVFFQSVPELSASISINAGTGGRVTAKGVNIPVGSSGTVQLDLYSDGVASDWQVAVQDYATWATYPYLPCQSATECDGQTMNITLSAGSGNNGDSITVTINPTKAPPSGTFPGTGYDIFVITSTQTSTGNQHFWFGLVGE